MLPVSRFDVLSVTVSGILGSLLSETPEENKTIAILLSAVTNLWAIVGSVLTAKDLFQDRDTDTNTHLWGFMGGILLLTIASSVCALAGAVPNIKDNNRCMKVLFEVTGAIMLTVLVHSFVQLYWAYSDQCSDPTSESTWCNFTPAQVREGLIIASVVTLVVSGIIVHVSLDDENCCCVLLTMVFYILRCLEVACNGIFRPCGRSGDVDTFLGVPSPKGAYDTKRSGIMAAVNRTSAFVKVCLFGVLWYFANGDMAWGVFTVGAVSWWVSGQ